MGWGMGGRERRVYGEGKLALKAFRKSHRNLLLKKLRKIYTNVYIIYTYMSLNGVTP